MKKRNTNIRVPIDKRIEEIENKTKTCKNIKEFFKLHPYLYRWCKKHNFNLRAYFPNSRPTKCRLPERQNKGIDCYIYAKNKFHKHYAFISDAMRELDISYYHIHKILIGERASINGFVFVKCQ